MGQIGSARVVDFALAASAASWAIERAIESARHFTLIDASIVATDIVVAVLFAVRKTLPGSPAIGDVAVVVPSLVSGAILLQRASTVATWTPVAFALVALGTAWTMASLATLGRSFAVVAARRPIVTHGPYALIRHPAYAGELTLAIGCAIACNSWASVSLVLVAVASTVARIDTEEGRLAGDAAYVDYTAHVRFRLVPRVW